MVSPNYEAISALGISKASGRNVYWPSQYQTTHYLTLSLTNEIFNQPNIALSDMLNILEFENTTDLTAEPLFPSECNAASS